MGLRRSTAICIGVLVLSAVATVSAQQAPENDEPVRRDPLTGEELPAETGPPLADLTEANERVRARDYAAAEALLAELQVEVPEDPRLLMMRGELLIALGRPGDAIPLLEKTVELDENRPRLHFQLAVARQAVGNRPGALEAFAKEIEINEDAEIRVMARLNRAMLLEQERDLTAAAAELEAVLQLDPERVELYGDVASLLIEAGKLGEAAAALDAGLAEGFHSAEHYYSLGARYYKDEDYESAIRVFRRALDIDPELASAERSLAAALDQLGRRDEAAAHLRRYLELAPDAPDAARVRDRLSEPSGS